jgi:hypothetical protein
MDAYKRQLPLFFDTSTKTSTKTSTTRRHPRGLQSHVGYSRFHTVSVGHLPFWGFGRGLNGQVNGLVNGYGFLNTGFEGTGMGSPVKPQGYP